jgi:chemotaxis signal transduction protein
MELTQNHLFIIYQLKRNGQEQDVSYYGCREIVIPDYKTSTYIRGMIEFEGNYIPVIDPNIYYQGQPSQLTNLACILVIEHIYECRSQRTGIIMGDIEEIINLVAGSYKTSIMKPSTFNMRFVLKILKKADADSLLSDTHTSINLRERQKQANADFIAFREIVGKGLVHI